MIYKENGSPYKLTGNIKTFDPQNVDHDLVNSIDQEIICISGAPVEYYKVIIDGRVDELYLEQRQKMFLTKPFSLMAVYEPPPTEQNLGPWTIDSIEEILFNFNKKYFLDIVGERPREGSIVRTCDENIYWEIIQVNINTPNEDRMIWGKQRYTVFCRKYQASVTDYSPSDEGREEWEHGNPKPYKIR